MFVGCGADNEASGELSKDEYETAFREIYAEEQTFPDPLEALSGSASPADAAGAFHEASDILDRRGEQLDALSPPADIAAEHTGFVENVEAASKVFERTARLIDDKGALAVKVTKNMLATPEGTAALIGATPEVAANRAAFAQAVEEGDYDIADLIEPSAGG